MEVKRKPTWVFVAGSYRTASTTQYQITRDIIEDTRNGEGIGYHTENKLREHDKLGNRYTACKVFEFLPEGFRGEPSLGAKFLEQNRLKAIVTVRNPLDIIVSMKRRATDLGKEIRNRDGRHEKGNDKIWSFEETATEHFPIWLGNTMKWVDLGPQITLATRFEDMTTDIHYEVRRIAAHLDIRVGGKHGHEIAERYSIKAIRKKHEVHKKTKKRIDPWLPSVPVIVFGSSNLYREWLTADECKMVIEANQEYMERFGYL